MSEPVSATELSRLKWRCRRGMLENDILIERFFQRFESQLTRQHMDGLQRLMDLADNDLLDLLLRRSEPAAELDCPAVAQTLALLRLKPDSSAPSAASADSAEPGCCAAAPGR